MRNRFYLMLALPLLFGMSGAALAQDAYEGTQEQEYEEEWYDPGDWFDDNDATQYGTYDEGYQGGTYYDDEYGYYEDDAYYDNEYYTDEYGAYDADYDWETDAGWFNDWYGDTEESWDDGWF